MEAAQPKIASGFVCESLSGIRRGRPAKHLPRRGGRATKWRGRASERGGGLMGRRGCWRSREETAKEGREGREGEKMGDGKREGGRVRV
jgi:hypothetical protein